jgi:hypothetical protein
LAIDEAKRPVVDVVPAAPPFIRPGEGDRAARALFEGGADVHRGDLGLAGLALADGVGARFRDQQRLLTGDVLQARQIRAQFRLPMEIDIERVEIEKREIEELRGWKVDVGEQAVG